MVGLLDIHLVDLLANQTVVLTVERSVGKKVDWRVDL